MPSGIEAVVFNTRERAVSNDQNRLQAFLAQGLGEFLREFLDTGCGTDDLDAGAISSENTTTGNPLRAEVVNGLWIEPQVGSLSLSAHSGLLYCVDPDSPASPDDSPYKYVKDAGVAFAGALAMTANASGSTRVDVVECQRQEVVVETDNRDVFNPSTGLFVATTVTKAVASKLAYRVRAGTPGAGFPGTAAGWLPLAVASVPTGTTTNDTITFWDVRPLLNDRAPSIQNATNARARRGNVALDGSDPTLFRGIADVAYAGRRLGGRIRRGSPGVDAATTIDLHDVANQDPACAALAANAMVYLYLCTPFSLPRWARYTDAISGSRIPRSPRGIPILSPAKPHEDGSSISGSAPVFPTSLGFVSSQVPGVAVAAGFWNSGALQPYRLFGEDEENVEGAALPTWTPGAGTTGTITLTAGTTHPPDARAIKIVASFGITIASPPQDLTIVLSLFGGTLNVDSRVVVGTDGFQFTTWIPVPPSYPADPTTLAVKLAVSGSGLSALTAVGLSVIGWTY